MTESPHHVHRVWIVSVEWRTDSDGSSVNSVFASKKGADDKAQEIIEELMERGNISFGRLDDDSTWDFDVHVDELEVEP